MVKSQSGFSLLNRAFVLPHTVPRYLTPVVLALMVGLRATDAYMVIDQLYSWVGGNDEFPSTALHHKMHAQPFWGV